MQLQRFPLFESHGQEFMLYDEAKRLYRLACWQVFWRRVIAALGGKKQIDERVGGFMPAGVLTCVPVDLSRINGSHSDALSRARVWQNQALDYLRGHDLPVVELAECLDGSYRILNGDLAWSVACALGQKTLDARIIAREVCQEETKPVSASQRNSLRAAQTVGMAAGSK